ncbi:MAG: tRNA-modifying protein YgfZ [Verrucomicrobiota bacterium]
MGRLLAATDGRLSSSNASTMTLPSSSERGIFLDCSRRVKLRISGTDAVRFLNGQITNDLRKATANFAIQASVLNAKGKLNGHVYISGEDNSFFLDADSELREELPARLERYVIADDVELEDVTDRYAVFHVSGEPPVVGLRPAREALATRFGWVGRDLWFEKDQAERIHGDLAKSLPFCDDDCAEALRIEQGVPRWGRELTNEIIPLEANLEATSIDYSKGCYIGQEVISRMKMSGQTNKRLCGLVSVSGEPLGPDMRLRAGAGERKEAGWITSAIRSSRLQKEIALGYVKRGFYSEGNRLYAAKAGESDGNAELMIEVVSLPFV